MRCKFFFMALAIALLLAGNAQAAPEFTYGFECPASDESVADGTQVDITVFATITTANNGLDLGVAGWTVSFMIEGAKFADETPNPTTHGIIVKAYCDLDDDPETPELDKDCDFSLDRGIWSVAQKATSDYPPDPAYTPQPPPGKIGVIAAEVMFSNSGAYNSLQPNGTARMVKFVLSVTAPTTVKLTYIDWMKGISLPNDNKVTFNAVGFTPAYANCEFNYGRPYAGGRRLPGDSNGDKKLDISDGLAMLGFLFLGAPKGLPCGDGSAADPGNKKLVDWQSDGRVDISDAVSVLNFLFLGGVPHELAVPGAEMRSCVPILGCSDMCADQLIF